MKPVNYFFCRLALVLTVLVPWCASAQTNVSVPDPNLENAVLSALGRTNGPLTTTDMLGLTNLSASSVTNLSGLEPASHLESLRLHYGELASLSPLTGLALLRTLALEYVPLSNAAGLSNLTTLTNLDLFLTPLTNVSCLTPLTNLLALDLSWTRVSDLAPLAALPHLRYLDLSGNLLGNCAALAGLTNLSGSLFLDSASLTNIDSLAGLTNLTELSLYQNPVSDLAPVSRLTSLSTLDLGYAPIRDFSGLAGLINLQRLYAEGTGVSNLNRLPLLPRLKVLDANYNRLGDLNALAGFTNLQWLNASYNCLTNIDGLTNLTALTTAYLQVNLLDTNAGSADMLVIQELQDSGVDLPYAPQNRPPLIAVPDHWIVPTNEVSSLWFSVIDDLTPGDHLVLDVRSSNPGFVTATLSQSPGSRFSFSSQTMLTDEFVGVPNGPTIPGWSGYLNLTPVSDQAGTATITVTATDDTGLTATAAIAVTAIPPTPFDSQALGNSSTNIIWRTFGLVPWQGQSNTVHEAESAAQSGSPESWLEASVTGPGLLTFWWSCVTSNWGAPALLTATCPVSGLTAHDSMSLHGPVFGGPGPGLTFGWQKSTLSIPAGSWVLRWQSQSSPAGSSLVWVAEVNFAPGPAVCWLETFVWTWIAPGYFFLDLHGPPGETYDLEASSDLRQWSRLARMTISDFQLSYADSAATTPAKFYRVHKSTLAPIWFEKPALEGSRLVQLTLHSEPGQPLAIECSTNLLNWDTLVQTNNPAGTLQIADRPLASSNLRFYRAKALPWGQYGTPGQPGFARRHNPFPPPLLPPGPIHPAVRNQMLRPMPMDGGQRG